jgi:hypothetical protein
MRDDFSRHLKAIAVIDEEVLSLVRKRVMVLIDTTLPFDRPEAVMRLARELPFARNFGS